ncbi:hypothetical protein [Clostridium merdae]|uniref:hypothetical protein n=1 Tax=Clostridium merdae TaxID=1958780 RepID=UPI000A26F491|nr:hypothetical protein [Clostridium merdae]
MTQQIIFADETTINVANINANGGYHQGAQRDSLEIQIAKDTISFDALDALDALTSEASKTDRLTIVTQDGDKKMQEVYDHYVLRTALTLKPIVVTKATASTPAVTEERLCVTLAQLTYTEVQQATQAAEIADMQAAIAALAFGGEA